jgi:hypothetical protein
MSAEQARERITTALGAIDAAHAALRDTSSDVVGNDFRVDVAERLETQERTNRGLMYRFFAESPTRPMAPSPSRLSGKRCGRGCGCRREKSCAAPASLPASGRGAR